MLRKASREDIVKGTNNLYDQYFWPNGESKTKITSSRLPYFDGDFLPGTIDHTIKCIQEDMHDAKKQNKPESKISRRIMRKFNYVVSSCESTNTDILLMEQVDF